ncbi:hypothetical protein AK88_00798 [Plasmodium fragile]|uniref:Uncharacterized protein n=1 Tax=Plasmodium fragile TaxID=5857 RepID=A0A0D9QU09_PLAFR|nr:uncharacterized protein AK88_00797 [Plasmodium fragile]XP_012333865.1 uncharacterized protein AK88_00798 [Plasmodium fragile]KJP89586.1 hypothetical protein AK88_00797 [Plasmodium fragile]KJP89587.1 hypothetical protein AK88_00798 [Plasmodium fragile]
MQPVKKTVISKNIKIVKKPDDIGASPVKSDYGSSHKDGGQAGANSADKSKSGATDNKSKGGADSNAQKNANASKNAAGSSGGNAQVGLFSWLWRYFPKNKA